MSGANGNGKAKSDDFPEPLRPYKFHGLDMNVRMSQVSGDCVACGKEGKWYADPKDGMWDCKVCGARGNVYNWIQTLWERSAHYTTAEGLRSLAEERGILFPETLARWGVRQSVLTGEWLVPGFNDSGALMQLYRYARVPTGGGRYRYTLLGTPTLNAGLFNVHNLMVKGGVNGKSGNGKDAKARDYKELWYCEGPWDGMVLEEVLARCKRSGDGLTVTGTQAMSMRSEIGVVAVPGANTFLPGWAKLGGGKKVVFAYDNDHDRPHPQTREMLEGAALAGIKRAACVYAVASTPATSLSYVSWGMDAQWTKSLNNGFDLRDLFKGADDVRGRIPLLQELLNNRATIPQEWIQGAKAVGGGVGETLLRPLPCTTWKELRDAWRKAMNWTTGLERALVCMLACGCGIEMPGEQLWMNFISPPSTGKTTLIEGVSVDRAHVTPKDTFTALFSGYQTDKEGTENQSLLLEFKGKMLAIKDADTIIQHPNRAQIMSQFRALFDRAVRVKYNNMMSIDVNDCNTAVVFCGTPSLAQHIDESDLGQRFITCCIMKEVDSESEEAINDKIFWHWQAQMEHSPVANGDGSETPEKRKAKRLTGGYLEHLCKMLKSGDKRSFVRIPDYIRTDLNVFARFTSFFRCRPSKLTGGGQRELSARLMQQYSKLAYCIALVYGKDEIDDFVMGEVRKVVLDTSDGWSLNVAKYLYEQCSREAGSEPQAVAVAVRETDEKCRTHLAFLSKIRVVEKFVFTDKLRQKRYRYRITDEVHVLYNRVVDPTHEFAFRPEPSESDYDYGYQNEEVQ